MTEHPHKTSQPAEEVNIQIGKEASGSSTWLLPSSILLGALLICGSLFYNSKLILTKLDNLSGGDALTIGSQAAQNQPAPSAPAVAQGGQQQPTGPVNVSDRNGQPTIGKDSAKVTIYEFSDFQCPFCTKFYKETYSQLKSQYIDTGKVKLVYRHFPLPFHNNAQKAAEAAECANRQGKFEAYYNLLFSNSQGDGTGLSIDDLKKYADSLGLNKGTLGFNKNQFNQCLDNSQTADIVKKDTSDGSAAGVTGTPSFVINGKLIVGAQPFDTFKQAIDEALK